MQLSTESFETTKRYSPAEFQFHESRQITSRTDRHATVLKSTARMTSSKRRKMVAPRRKRAFAVWEGGRGVRILQTAWAIV